MDCSNTFFYLIKYASLLSTIIFCFGSLSLLITNIDADCCQRGWLKKTSKIAIFADFIQKKILPILGLVGIILYSLSFFYGGEIIKQFL